MATQSPSEAESICTFSHLIVYPLSPIPHYPPVTSFLGSRHSKNPCTFAYAAAFLPWSNSHPFFNALLKVINPLLYEALHYSLVVCTVPDS